MTFLYSGLLSGGSSSTELLLIYRGRRGKLVGKVTGALAIGGEWENDHMHTVVLE